MSIRLRATQKAFVSSHSKNIQLPAAISPSMGKYKFRFADMIPNAWFYKLKDMGKHKQKQPSNHKSSITNSSSLSSLVSSSLVSSASSSSFSSSASVAAPNHTLSEQRKSYYFTRELNSQPPNTPGNSGKQFRIETPRRSSRRRRSIRRSREARREKQRSPVDPPIGARCNCGTTMEFVWADPAPEFTPGENPKSPLVDLTSSCENDSVLTEFGSGTPDGVLSWPTLCKRHAQNDTYDDGKKFGKSLHPIIPKKNEHPLKIQTHAQGSLSVKIVKTESVSKDVQKTTTPVPVRRFPVNPTSPGVKLRPNSPRIGPRRIQTRKNVGSNSVRRGVIDSFAVVKSSKNPRWDFTSSMLEMIVENNLRGSNELEDLLACYLSLNLDEYHDLIISVFKQIWFDFIHARTPMGK